MRPGFLITIVSVTASLIGVFTFFTGKHDIFQVIEDRQASSSTLVPVRASLDSLSDGIYIEPSYIRRYPKLFQIFLEPLSLVVGGDHDMIYTVKNHRRTLLVQVPFSGAGLPTGTQYVYPFVIRLSSTQTHLAINFGFSLHIADVDGDHHNKYRIEGGTAEGVEFISENDLHVMIRRHSYSSEIVIGQYRLGETGLYELQFDENNLLVGLKKASS